MRCSRCNVELLESEKRASEEHGHALCRDCVYIRHAEAVKGGPRNYVHKQFHDQMVKRSVRQERACIIGELTMLIGRYSMDGGHDGAAALSTFHNMLKARDDD